MQISSLTVKNFRGISNIQLNDIPDAVVIAGPNGCGKSCVLDAIRLLKSAYGSYEQDEMQQFFGEHQIDAKKEIKEAVKLFQDRSKPLCISAKFIFSSEEKKFLTENIESLAVNLIFRELAPNSGHVFPGHMNSGVSTKFKSIKPAIDEKLKKLLPILKELILKPNQLASVTISPHGMVDVLENDLLELVFVTYLPQKIGIIDYHGAHRTYNRHNVTNINLTIENTESQLRSHALYNSANKYANLKTEITGSYIRNLLICRANPSLVKDDLLTSTLKELFTTFFPGKEFLGPQPTEDGRLTFLVRLSTGQEHDIDELSSGEKEVVYGYLRLHSAAPRNSIIMIDEPELHLNPKLISGLAAFYYRHLGARLGNQLWLVTHSDTLIREAVDNPKFSVFHIQPAGTSDEPQATSVKAKGELDRVIMALVGDLAGYRPNGKVVVFESTLEAAFDMQMTCILFPELERQTNPISAGNKKNVGNLYDLLECARVAGHLDKQFFAITDSDDDALISGPSTRFQWDVYHIENYLLSPKHILEVVRSAGIKDPTIQSEQEIEEVLHLIAEETISDLIAHRLRVVVNKEIVTAIDLGFDPARKDTVDALAESIARTSNRILQRASTNLSIERLQELQSQHTENYKEALTNGTWKNIFRGRDILKRFVGIRMQGMPYEIFRSLLLNKMAEQGHKPSGMEKVVSQILDA